MTERDALLRRLHILAREARIDKARLLHKEARAFFAASARLAELEAEMKKLMN